MIQHRFAFISSLLLALVLAGCALPGLGARPLSAASGTQPQKTEENRPATPTERPTALQGSQPPEVTPTRPNPPTPDFFSASPSPTARPPILASSSATAPVQKPALTPGSFSMAAPEPAPAGILAQVSFFQTGGGSGYNGADCDSRPGELRWCKPLNGARLALTAEYRGTACGLGSLPLKASLFLPDGSIQPLQVQGEPPYCREISYAPHPNALPGNYRVSIEQGGLTLVDTFQWLPPDHPAGALIQSCAWLAGLSPDQPVRLLIFGQVPVESNPSSGLGLWRYLAERRLAANSTGVLWACPDHSILERFPRLAYLADLPGKAPLSLGEEDLLQQFQGNCADSPSTQLAVGKQAHILAKTLPIFPDPALNERATGALPAGSKGTILDGPVCPPQGPWVWKIAMENGPTGWIAESDTTSYFIEPVR